MEKVTYGEIRKAALKQWLTGRRLKIKFDDNRYWIQKEDTAECRHQKNEFAHINILCSLSDFSLSIVDILNDKRFDNLPYDIIRESPPYDSEDFYKEEINSMLFRIYARLFLAASEIIVDLRAICKVIGIKKPDNKLSKSGTEIGNIADYINSVFKHKDNNFHIANDHIGIHFLHSKVVSTMAKPITLKFLLDEKIKWRTERKLLRKANPSDNKLKENKTAFFNDADFDGLVVPELSFLLDSLIFAYDKLDELLNDNVRYEKLLFSKYVSQSERDELLRNRLVA